MKSKLIVFNAVAVTGMAMQVWAADPQNNNKIYREPSDKTFRDREELRTSPARQRLGEMEKAEKILGMEIKNSQDQKIGKVKDLAINFERGRIAEVIASINGVSGLIAAPPQIFMVDRAEKVLRVHQDQDQFKNAPKVDLSKWKETTQNAQVMEVYHFYGTTSDYFNEGSAVEGRLVVKGGEGTGYLERASKVIGMPARNLQDEKLGKVEDLMVDLQAGRITEVVISSGGFLGIGDELSVVPPTVFRFNPERDRLQLDTTREALKEAPHFKSGEWPDVGEPAYVTRVYKSYQVEPYWSSDADNTARNVRDRDSSTLKPTDQGSNKGDVSTTAQIRKAILAREGMSVNARNVKIITLNGRVTLRGTVNTEEERQRIGEIAARIVPANNVDNQLEVKRGAPRTTTSD